MNLELAPSSSGQHLWAQLKLIILGLSSRLGVGKYELFFNYVWLNARRMKKTKRKEGGMKETKNCPTTIRKHLPKNLFQLRIAGDVRQRKTTSDSCNTTCNMQHATSIYLSMCVLVCVCGENNKHNGHILYFRQCAPRACNKKQRAIVNKDAA